MAQKPTKSKKKLATSKDGAGEKAKKTRRPGELSRFQKGVIILFIAVFALSTLAGAFASMVQTNQSNSQKTITSVADLDETYQPLVDNLEEKVAADASDKDSLKALGGYYSQWGIYVRTLGTTDEDTSHANDLFEKAIAAYDSYLELEDSDEVRVSRALAQYYEGRTSEAQSALEELTEKSPDYAPAWANLGLIYEATSATEEAKAAYQKAIETDSDDEAGAKSYAEKRLSAIEEAENGSDDDGSTDDGSSDDGTADDGSSSGSGAEDLANDLASGDGL